MRITTLVLALTAALLIGCGAEKDDTTKNTGDSGTNNSSSGDSAGTGIALNGAGWDGGDGIDPTKASDKIRIVQFLKPK